MAPFPTVIFLSFDGIQYILRSHNLVEGGILVSNCCLISLPTQSCSVRQAILSSVNDQPNKPFYLQLMTKVEKRKGTVSTVLWYVQNTVLCFKMISCRGVRFMHRSKYQTLFFRSRRESPVAQLRVHDRQYSQ